jgi:rfaE bifunctional protein nucleotidyltransferase chain/domain
MNHPPPFLAKICERKQLMPKLAGLPKPWVFTNGVFDVLHRGHVVYLAQARELGGSLIVALNTDASVRRLGKGEDRPLNAEMDRAIVMASQQSVSLVTWFDEDTPIQLIAEIRPDTLVKGGDYDMEKLAETALVKSWGGRALALPFVQGYSTTALLGKIQGAVLNTKSHRAKPAARSASTSVGLTCVGSSFKRARCWIWRNDR